jgi:hypothetical protein
MCGQGAPVLGAKLVVHRANDDDDAGRRTPVASTGPAWPVAGRDVLW